MGSIEGGLIGFGRPIGKTNSASTFQKTAEMSAGTFAPATSADTVELHGATAPQAENAARALFFDINLRVSRHIANATQSQTESVGLHMQLKLFEVYEQPQDADVVKEDAVAMEERLRPLAQLQEYFSPENTAGRILDFALSRYGYGHFAGPDSSENRAQFRDFIFPAIEKGFQEATDSFRGTLPEEIMDQVHETLSKIKVGFENFIAAGNPGNGEAGATPSPV